MDYSVFCKLYESLVEINTACMLFLGWVKMQPTLHRRAIWAGPSNMKQKIEACRLYFKIQGTAENRVVSKVLHWSSTHGNFSCFV